MSTYDLALATNLIQRACVGDTLTRTTARFGDRLAVIDGDRQFTYSALNDAVNQVARSLLESGLRRGDTVAIMSRNHWVVPVTYFAAAKAGLVYLPLNVALTAGEMGYILEEAEAKVLVAEDVFEDKAQALVAQISTLERAYIVGETAPLADGVSPFEELMTGSTAEVEVLIEDRDTLQLLYTSGTTARPKGVEGSHLAVLLSGLSTAVGVQLQHTDVSLSVMPLFHTGQLNTMFVPHVLVGGCSVMLRQYDPAAAIDALATHHVTTALMTGPMWVGLLDHPSIHDRDFGAMRKCIIGAASLSPERVDVLRRTFPNADCQLFSGQTEFTPPNELQRPEHAISKTTSWGAPTVTMGIQVMDDAGRLLSAGEVGELVYRGPQAMTRYFKNPEATAEAFRFGWFHTGDVGWIDEENVVWFVDRRKDMVKTGGENVATLEVELAISGHPGVAECAVVGLPHERWTEAVTAFVRLSPGSSVSDDELLAYCRDRLAGYKVPKSVVLVDELPRSSSGKILKFELRTMYHDFYAGSATPTGGEPATR